MTRFRVVLLPALALIASAIPSQSGAQLKKPIAVNLSAGYAAPTGTFGNGHDGGFNLSGGVTFQQRPSPIGLRLEGMFNQFRFTGGMDNTNVIAATANVIITVPAQTGPYLIGGAGIYNVTVPFAFGASDSKTSAGANVGAGFRFSLSSFDAFAEARWHQAGYNTQFVPITFGVVF